MYIIQKRNAHPAHISRGFDDNNYHNLYVYTWPERKSKEVKKRKGVNAAETDDIDADRLSIFSGRRRRRCTRGG